MVVAQLIAKATEILKGAGIESYILDTHILLCEFLKKDKTFIFTNRDFVVENEREFFALVERRAKNEPIAYITGHCEFMSLDFEVNTGVLIPRADTEILTQCIIDYAGERPISMLEIGTGSGCISISCAKYCDNLKITAVDFSEQALETAKRNAKKHNINNIDFLKMNILEDFPNMRFDIVASNPPYIETDVIPSLMNDVKNYEPLSALDGGNDGLIFYRRIAEKARGCGLIAFEVGHNQSGAVSEILFEYGYKSIKVFRDLSSIERVVLAMGDMRMYSS